LALLKETVQILDAIEALPGVKYVSVGILPISTYNYTISTDGISGNRLPILYTISQAMDQGGTILIKHRLAFNLFKNDRWEPVFHLYALLLGEKMYRVCTEIEFHRFFKQTGIYKSLKVKSCGN
jgi:hypothetical protein